MSTKVSALTADTAPTGDDELLSINDPGGTPAERRITIDNLFKSTQEIWIPAAAMQSINLTNGAQFDIRELATNDVLVAEMRFDTTTSEKAQFTWTPPINWNAGTVRFKAYWTNDAGLTTETIDFDLAGTSFADSDAMDAALNNPQNITDTWLAQDDMHISAYSSAITINGSPVAGEMVIFQLSRDVAADNMTGDVGIIGITLEFTIDQRGTT